MRGFNRWLVVVSLGLAVLAPQAEARAQAAPAALDSLRQVAVRIGARLDSLEAGLCPPAGPAPGLAVRPPTGDPTTDSLAATLDRLESRVNSLALARCAAAQPARADSTTDELAALRAAAAEAAGGQPADTTQTQFVGRQRNLSVLNPEISVTGDVRLIARDESPQQENGVAREFEFAFQAALDPYSHAKVFISIEQEEVGIEEGYAYWTGLPGRLRLDVGKFRQQVGELNRWHLHALPETEYPLVYQRYLGPEGLSGIGLGLYTTLPISLGHGTHEVFLQGTTTEGDSLLAGGTQPTLLARSQNFWQLSRSTYFQFGLTAFGGNNDEAELESRVFGADLRFSWRPPSEGTRRDLTIRAEGYGFHSVASGEPTTRYGGFVDLQFRASRRWILGGRYDYVEAARGPSSTEWQVTPALTWWQSEFVYLRLEGQHYAGMGTTAKLISLQVVFAMGPHKHETY
jgi:hypothetical protein